ncbi:putative multidrug ABC transporter ATP-binding protein YbhF [Thermoflexales bacterium]|nr:putative multidrug ABC transporter ATP-binding protein YbhF [Thermoflexales bacterium]
MRVSNNPSVIICTTQLSRSFRKIAALRAIDLSIQRGEIFGLVGPDGAGKTTMLRLLAAVMTPTAGQVTVVGHDSVKDAEKIRGQVGYMPQRFSLYGDLSVQENLQFYADIFGVHGPERQRRFEQVLSFAHMSDIPDRRAKQLSGGMQKKLGLACTLIHRPDVLLLDEPTTGVDPVSRREFWDLLTELHLQGTTIVVSTPYMDEAERCNRIGLLFKGELIECGTPREIKALVQGQVVEFHPDRLEVARAVLSHQPGVLEVQVYGTLLHVFVEDATVVWPRLQTVLGEAEVKVDNVRLIHPRMEEAFISLIRRQVG